MSADPGNEFEVYEELVAPAFQGATGPLSVSFGNAEVALVAATVAPQTVDGLVSVLPEPMVRAVVFLEGAPGLEEHPFLLALTVEDAKVAAGLMMDPGSQEPPADFEDFHRSAVEELLGYVGESLAQDLSARTRLTISSAVRNTEVLTFASEQEAIEDLADGEPLALASASYLCANRVLAFAQVASAPFVRALIGLCQPQAAAAPPPVTPPEPAPPPAAAPKPAQRASDMAVTQDEIEAILSGLTAGDPGPPPARPSAAPAAAQRAPAGPAPPPPAAPPRQPPPEARSARFEELSTGSEPSADLDNFPLIADIPIQLSVELGRTHRTIKEILEFGQGYTIRLDKAADEPVDICAGGRTIARGEVVVIDENFAVRIRQIVRPAGSWLHEDRGD